MAEPTKREPEKIDHMESLKQQASACGPDCGCHAGKSSSRIRAVLGIVILVAAVAMATRAMIKDKGAATQSAPAAFAAPAPAQPSVPASISMASAAAPVSATEIPGFQKGQNKTAVASPAPKPKEPATVIWKNIGAIMELNTVATDVDAVFVFLAGKKGESIPAAEVNRAVRTIEKQGNTVGLFALKVGSPDYERVAAQVAAPAILAMVKGKGMSVVSGGITETKLVQGFVAASSAASCGPSGCGPSTPGCN